MARSKTFVDKFAVVDALNALSDNAQADISRFLKEQLVESGFLDKVKIEKRIPGRGRKPMAYTLTGKGKSYKNLARSWKRPINVVNEIPVTE